MEYFWSVYCYFIEVKDLSTSSTTVETRSCQILSGEPAQKVETCPNQTLILFLLTEPY